MCRRRCRGVRSLSHGRGRRSGSLMTGFRSRWGSNPTPGFRSVGFEPDSWVARGFDPGIPSDPEYRPQGVDPKGCGAEAPSSGVDPTEFIPPSLRRRGCRSRQAWGVRSVMIARQRSGAAEARWAHNPKVPRSKLGFATFWVGWPSGPRR